MGDSNGEPRVGADGGAAHEASREREVTVLVTGYGPFLDFSSRNASWSVASNLPTSLPATPTCPRIRIVKHPEPIKVAYQTVYELVPKLLTKDEEYDIIFHIGLAAKRTYYSMERQSTREPYWEEEDVDGRTFSREATNSVWPSDAYPLLLKPTFNLDDVWLRWRNNVNSGDVDIDIRPSDDPGNFLCGFIYYLSMSWFWKKERKERPVMFLHVPDLPRESDVKEGVMVAQGLIRALAESRMKWGAFDPLKPAERAADHVMGAAEIPLGRDNNTATGP